MSLRKPSVELELGFQMMPTFFFNPLDKAGDPPPEISQGLED